MKFTTGMPARRMTLACPVADVRLRPFWVRKRAFLLAIREMDVPYCGQFRELIATSFATVLRFLEVPSRAAGICSLDCPIPQG